MYNILIVDEEPIMLQLLMKLMMSSGLNIGHIYTTSSGKEALTYARTCHIDLLISDIHTRDLSGIELMQQIRMLQPDIQLIVISVHEQFEYAQTAIRLGVRNYLVKPLNSEQFLDSIREVLIHLEKPVVERSERQPVYTVPGGLTRFKMERLPEREYELLSKLLTGSIRMEEQEQLQQYLPLKGPYYAMLKMNFDGIQFAGSTGQPNDYRWLCYAIWNVTEELLEVEDQENTIIFESGDKELSVIFQWRETDAADRMSHIIRQLEALGQSLHFHIHKFLRIPCVIGISQILRGIHFLSQLNTQTDRAIDLHREYQDHYVFYYGKYYWKTIRPAEEAECLRNNLIVSQVKSYLDNYYNQKGLTIHEVARKNHVSPNYLSYLFKKYTGFKLWEYVIKLRMEESRELLTSTDLRRYEVADKVGYESPEHFSKIFKKYYGISPSEFKQLQI
ncbi:response regulator [Paenibacillus wulumuqiensis]|uniref:response regulator n=1 Tax=Paenibacillus wulumuqiensis TaxID=1567107 RepID=UPI0006192E31|nr:response regulator [Paenibacillus wulumuqiensis]